MPGVGFPQKMSNVPHHASSFLLNLHPRKEILNRGLAFVLIAQKRT